MKKLNIILFFTIILCMGIHAQSTSIYVSVKGNDKNTGTKNSPIASLEQAQILIRDILKTKPTDTITVFIRKGTYRLRRGLVFYSKDSGTKIAPIVFRNYKKEKVIISGAIPINSYKPIKDITLLKNQKLKNKVVEIYLRKAGLSNTDIVSIRYTGRNATRKSHVFREIYLNGEPMPLSRWPNNGFINTGSLVERHGIHGQEYGFTYSNSRISKWKDYSNMLLHGYWRYLWDDDFEYVSEIDTTHNVVWLRTPYNYFGFHNHRPFAAFNLVEEIDKEGEWAYDYYKEKLYFYVPTSLKKKNIEFSICDDPLIHFVNTRNITIKNITLELTAFEGIRISSSNNILIENCTIHGCAADGIRIVEGKDIAISSCEIYNTGRGGIRVSGGNRENLEKSGYLIDNCHIHNISRIDRTYTPGVWVDGVGTRISHCEFHDIPSSALRINGNDHIIEYNNIHHVVTESDDQGAIDMYGDPTYRGNVFRYNYIHDIGPKEIDPINAHCGRAGIRLDDAISGNIIYGNIFENCSNGSMGAVQIHGGKENKISNNLFYKCMIGVSYNRWGYNKWIRNTQKGVDFLQKHRQIYISRYPELSDINKNLNINNIYKNIFLRCKRITDDDSDKELLEDNIQIKATKYNRNLKDRNYKITHSSSLLERMKFISIPFEKIGLKKKTNNSSRSDKDKSLSFKGQ